MLSRPSPVPQRPGVYAWYFSELPTGSNVAGCHLVEGQTLLYVGISPKAPPENGRLPSRQTLRTRLRTHFGGNAEGSTLRLTLGCLLAERLGITLRRVGSGRRYTFTNPGECVLDTWMAQNAFVTWIEHQSPWVLERELLRSGLVLPLNIHANPREDLRCYLSAVRARARRAAEELPILSDNGGPRQTR
ncbi:GIY-YIG nuclease family protein [Methylorubrum sp. POS3]|uniref:GIY-YIG nuclease family protein n=1 Tax=Methylorubrum sp. POS3 TaxID=2998492 RepID=UPI00372CE738